MEKKKQLIGLSVRNMHELQSACYLRFDVVEIKIGSFSQSGTPLYFYKNGEFKENKIVLKEIIKLTSQFDVSVQFHMPICSGPTLEREKGIHLGIKEHHEIAIKRFIFLEKLYQKYGIGSVITEHFPLVLYKGEQILEKDIDVIENTAIFIQKLDEIRKKDVHSTKICFENCGDLKARSGVLGFLVEHFETILFGSKTIGLTLDVGHLRMAKNFNRKDFFELGYPVNNVHFHGNAGKFDLYSFNDDQHLLPTRDNVTDYNGLIKYFRKHKMPIIFELNHMEQYTGRELVYAREKLKKELSD